MSIGMKEGNHVREGGCAPNEKKHALGRKQLRIQKATKRSVGKKNAPFNDNTK